MSMDYSVPTVHPTPPTSPTIGVVKRASRTCKKLELFLFPSCLHLCIDLRVLGDFRHHMYKYNKRPWKQETGTALVFYSFVKPF